MSFLCCLYHYHIINSNNKLNSQVVVVATVAAIAEEADIVNQVISIIILSKHAIFYELLYRHLKFKKLFLLQEFKWIFIQSISFWLGRKRLSFFLNYFTQFWQLRCSISFGIPKRCNIIIDLLKFFKNLAWSHLHLNCA